MFTEAQDTVEVDSLRKVRKALKALDSADAAAHEGAIATLREQVDTVAANLDADATLAGALTSAGNVILPFSFVFRSDLDPSRRSARAPSRSVMWRRSSLFDPVKAGVGTWIFTIARNKRVDRFRRENRGPLDPDDPMLHGEPDVPAVQAIETAEEARSLRAAIAELPPEQASIVRLHYFASKAHSEIARDHDLPIGTVKSRLRLAIGRLRKALGNTAA